MMSIRVRPAGGPGGRGALRFWFTAVAVVALASRLLLWVAYEPVIYGDTPSYWRLAASVANGFARYDGTRTPGYPAFLAAAGSDAGAWIGQMAFGVLTTFLFFGLGWLATGRPWVAGIAGLGHTLNLGQLLFEGNLITETLSTFWVTLAMWLVFLWLTRPRHRGPWLALLLALVVTLAWLTRPIFVFLPGVVFLFLLFAPEEKSAEAIESGASQTENSGGRWPQITLTVASAAAFLIPAAVLLFAWTNFIHSRFKVWSLSAMTGYHLVQHSGHLFEHLPDEHAALRDTYLRYREAQIASRGTQTNAIWDAIPELQRATGLNFYALSRHLTSISVELILAHPGPYLRNVAEGWWLFWRAPFYWSAEALRWPALAGVLSATIAVQRAALVGANLLFMVTSLAGLVSRHLRNRWQIAPALWSVAATVWAASILQTLLDHGDNPRFLVPMQSLVVLWCLVLVGNIVRDRFLEQGSEGELKVQ